MADRPLPGWPRGLCEELAAAYVGLSVTTIRAERAAGRFPAPIPLTRGRIVWLKEDLDRYLDLKAGRASEIEAEAEIEAAFRNG
ncbi:MAG: hypothetical protein JOY71_19380 [Acetobacteraceae bacterium]|nr:hypothetical protein [Acetobacteraceae bacterium]MBV8524257.1 hypothetical protein [Acetobacteraceae bacterium]MBV8590931.1 hypothetical protein [Acetobacteraceae bacterium]